MNDFSLVDYFEGATNFFDPTVIEKKSDSVVTASWLATSPDRCPPIPSATAQTRYSGKRRRLSSLCSRCSPTSLIPWATARIRIKNLS